MVVIVLLASFFPVQRIIYRLLHFVSQVPFHGILGPVTKLLQETLCVCTRTRKRDGS